MPVHVTDVSSNRQDKIANAARVIGRSKIRQRVFEAIAKGKKLIKTVPEIKEKTGLSYMQIRKAGVVLAHEEIIGQTPKVKGWIAYRREAFYSKNRKAILSLARNPARLEKYPTSYSPKSIGGKQFIRITVPVRSVRARRITVDEVESFKGVRKIGLGASGKPFPERAFKKGLQAILGERGKFNDWGGETDDLFSTRLKIGSKRVAAAFGLKGKGTKGKLNPKKMGKNGDQIQRLFRSPADAFIVQYHGEVDSSVHELMERLAMAKSAAEGRIIYYGVMDGNDSARLIKAYPNQFRLRA